MDFSKFDNRGPAETGQRLELVDPVSGETVKDGKKVCAVIVRGAASRSVQSEMRARQKAKMAKTKGKPDDDARVMEDIHNDLCETAAPLIVGFENVERDGKPLTLDPDDVKWFLGLTFPVMGVKKDEDGAAVMGPDGAPQFEMRNNPFAKQIAEFSSEMAMTMGNGAAR